MITGGWGPTWPKKDYVIYVWSLMPLSVFGELCLLKLYDFKTEGIGISTESWLIFNKNTGLCQGGSTFFIHGIQVEWFSF